MDEKKYLLKFSWQPLENTFILKVAIDDKEYEDWLSHKAIYASERSLFSHKETVTFSIFLTKDEIFQLQNALYQRGAQKIILSDSSLSISLKMFKKKSYTTGTYNKSYAITTFTLVRGEEIMVFPLKKDLLGKVGKKILNIYKKISKTPPTEDELKTKAEKRKEAENKRKNKKEYFSILEKF